MATAIHPNFKMPVVTYLCQQNSDTIDDVKRRLIKELVDRVKEPQIVTDFQEAVPMDRDEMDVSNQLYYNLIYLITSIS